ncbi:MAG: rhodanese-like domain-containing protein [Alphaproteobacteria bacterium]
MMQVGLLLATLLFLTTALTHPALAIPAPDLIVGSVSSLSQLLALLSVVIGGTAFAGSRLTAAGLQGRSSMTPLFRWAFLAAVVLLLGSGALNVYQWFDRIDERNAHLRATLTRPAKERGKRVVDPSMRELTYKQQTEHPLGIPTDEVAALLEARKNGGASDVFFLDIRENVETEMGRIEGFNTIRFPDFWAAVKSKKLDPGNKLIIVFCHNGNRSHETTEDLVARGLRSKFMVGGFQKWYVEGRPIEGLAARTPETLRAITRYPGDKKLLDLAEVKRLIEKENAIFVDIRYRLEYEDRHLPEAINIPIRKTPTPELHAMIQALPKRPIIIPCYDRRGCFFGRILGYELYKAGFDFRGRFTHPYDYFEMKPLAQRLPHVAKWRALAEQSLWDRAIVSLSRALYWSVKQLGTIIVGLFVLALAARMLILPFTVKAERDQIATRALAEEISALKARLKDDPKRLLRAINALHRKHGITPVRNLLALAFLPVFVISITAIELAAGVTPERFLWMADISAPDPFLVLPFAFSALICLYIQLAVTMSRKGRLWVWVLGFPLLGAAMLGLSAAANLYAVFAALLVLAQQRLVTSILLHPSRKKTRRRVPSQALGVVPLTDAHHVEGTGNKAARLGRLIEAGFPVPEGLVLTRKEA